MSSPASPISSSQPDTQQLYEQYQLAIRQLQYFESQEAQIISTIDELSLNVSTIDGLEKFADSIDIIIPLGATIQLKAKLSEIKEILVNIGSGVIVPTSYENAKKILNEKLEEMKKVMNQIVSEKRKLEEITSQLQTQLNNLNVH